ASQPERRSQRSEHGPADAVSDADRRRPCVRCDEEVLVAEEKLETAHCVTEAVARQRLRSQEAIAEAPVEPHPEPGGHVVAEAELHFAVRLALVRVRGAARG